MDKIKKSCGDVSLDALRPDGRIWADFLYEPETQNNEQPSPEQVFIREAIKVLPAEQRAIWEYWNYDRLTQDEIAEKLSISQPAVSKYIQRAEQNIIKWCKKNMKRYKTLKGLTA